MVQVMVARDTGVYGGNVYPMLQLFLKDHKIEYGSAICRPIFYIMNRIKFHLLLVKMASTFPYNLKRRSEYPFEDTTYYPISYHSLLFLP